MDVVGWLERNSFFGSLSDKELQQLAAEFIWREYDSGQIICRQGDDARSLLVVVDGRIEVVETGTDGRESIVGEVGPHEFFGEIGLISGEARSATGRAIRDTFALELSEASYQRLLGTHQELVKRLIRLVVHRIRSHSQVQSRTHTVAIVPISDVPLADFCSNLIEALSRKITATVVGPERIARELPLGDIEASGLDVANLAILQYLGALETNHDCVVYVCDRDASPWTCRSIRQADRIFLVAAADSNPSPQEVERLLLPGKLRARVRKELVLLYQDSAQLIGQTLQWISPRTPDAVHYLRRDREADFDQLAQPLVEAISGPAWLRSSALFASFDHNDLRLLASELETVHLPGHQVLFEKGSIGDGLFLVVSGRLQALVIGDQGEETIFGEMGPGEVVGEIALLTGESRTATVRAIRDTKLVKLSKAAFDRVAALRPQLVFQLARVIVERLGGRRRANQQARSVNFVVAPLSPQVNADAVMQSLIDGFSLLGRTTGVGAAAIESRLGVGASEIDKSHPGDPAIVEWLNQLEGEFDFVLYLCDADVTHWTLRCLRQADRVLFVDAATSSPNVGKLESRIRGEIGSGNHVPAYLLLVHEPNASEGSGTKLWLEPRILKQHFHVRRDNRSDFSRVARLLTNRGFGIVLGGGGSRGVAHVGVYRAILESGLPIDVVCGASAGAAIGGLIAMGDPPDVALDKCRAMMVRALGHLLSFGPPIVSMMSGRHPNRLLAPWYDERRIEDQFIPIIITSTDIVQGTLWIHETGLLRHAARASSSLPAAWPPVTDGGQLLVDGGVLNNLPIDLIKPLCRDGFAIASDISSEPDYSNYSQYGYEISGWSLLGEKLFPFRKRRKVPSLMDVISRCCTLASAAATKRQLGDDRVLYLQVPVGDYGMFAIRDAETVNQVEQKAYEFALAELARWRRTTFGGNANADTPETAR